MDLGEILRCRYKILEVLGNNAFGSIYLAEDIDRPYKPYCVVRKLKVSAETLSVAKRTFERQVQALYRLGNEDDRFPNILAMFEEIGYLYLVEEFAIGENLSNLIIPGKKWIELEIIQLLEEILEVLVVLHAKNIVHRDIKPANLIRRKDGKITILTGGMIKEVGTLAINAEKEPVPSTVIGTPGFMPSEQAFGDPKLSSDIYAVGMLGIYALTGIPPHELPINPTNGEIIWQEWAQVNNKTADILIKMVRYSFRERYQSAFDALEAIVRRKAELMPRSLKPSKRRILKILSGLGTGLGLILLGGQFFPANSVSIQNFGLGSYCGIHDKP